MSDDKLGPARRPRPLSRPQLPPGPLRELKDLLYELYAQAGCPTLDQITEGIRGDDSLAGAPQRDTIRRVLSSPELPASQHDAVAVATVLARAAGWDAGDTASRARQAWVAARLAVPLGRPLREITDPFGLEVHRCIDVGTAGLPVLPPYVQREHDKQLEQVLKAVTKEQASRIVVLVGGRLPARPGPVGRRSTRYARRRRSGGCGTPLRQIGPSRCWRACPGSGRGPWCG